MRVFGKERGLLALRNFTDNPYSPRTTRKDEIESDILGRWKVTAKGRRPNAPLEAVVYKIMAGTIDGVICY